ncbi:pyridoxamine 5'-phosphate oxidase family protein [Gallicola sp. Sow4_E12]|uniref:pyridoxamine 5'-phosphate oxidase family protein n=1 Tax=Gallicola sp. Sow4_E12 TaxID=3438785 RepID=UPI003F923249
MKKAALTDLIKREDVVFFNFVDHGNLYSRPMTVHDNKDGTIFLLTSRNSELYLLLQTLTIVNLTLTKENTFLVLQGKYTWSQDKKLIDEYWDEMAEQLLKLPKDDSSVTVVQFKVEEFHYWKTPTEKSAE